MPRPHVPHAEFLEYGEFILIPASEFDRAPVSGSHNHVLWALPGGAKATTARLRELAQAQGWHFRLVLVGKVPR